MSTEIESDDRLPEEDEAGPRLVVSVNSESIEPFGEVILTARIEWEEPLGDIRGEVVFLDDAGAEIGIAALTDGFDPEPHTARLEKMAPERPGAHVWMARLISDDIDCEDATFTVNIAAHPISVTVWDVPPAIEQGVSFPMTIGLRCPCGCDAKGWSFQLLADDGRTIAAGTVGDEPWPGTSSLYYIRLDLAAPGNAGQHQWTVVAEPPESEVPHAERRLKVHLNVTPPPEVTLRVEAYDAVSKASVPRAKVVVHPYRTMTDGEGVAELRLPRGPYTLFVSRSPYFAFKASGEISEDMTIRAELHEDRAISEAEIWA